jgi:hypothetical protein
MDAGGYWRTEAVLHNDFDYQPVPLMNDVFTRERSRLRLCRSNAEGTQECTKQSSHVAKLRF